MFLISRERERERDGFDYHGSCIHQLIFINITFTNYRLAKIGYVPNDLCTFCGIELETVNQLFYECSDFASFWYLVSGKRVDLTLQDVLLGKLDREIELFNYFITLVKLHIRVRRKRGVTPNLSAFKDIVEVKFRTEKYIAMKENAELYFQTRWQPYVQFILET